MEQAVLDNGLTLKEFAGVTIDEAYSYTNDDGNEVKVDEIYSIRPMEIIPMLVNRVQKQEERIGILEEKLEELTKKVEAL